MPAPSLGRWTDRSRLAGQRHLSDCVFRPQFSLISVALIRLLPKMLATAGCEVLPVLCEPKAHRAAHLQVRKSGQLELPDLAGFAARGQFATDGTSEQHDRELRSLSLKLQQEV